MKRRNFLKLGLFASLGVAGSAGLLKIYKHATGAGDILQYPDPTLRRVAAPVNVIDSSILSLGRQMVATLQYQSLVGFFSKAFMSR